jgi:hypothetical protein
MVGAPGIGHREEMDDLPDQDVARDFYAKYEPKEVLGRYQHFIIGYNLLLIQIFLLYLYCYYYYILNQFLLLYVFIK